VGDAGQGAAVDRIATVPNALSLIRLACIPVFLWLVFGEEDHAAAALLLAALGATDWVDGYVARRFDQVSAVGKVLDPTADRLLLVVGIGTIIAVDAAPAWVAWAAVVREAVVAVAAVALAALGARRIDVTRVGKAGTFATMTAFPLFLAASSDLSWAATARALGWVCAIPGLVLSYWAAITYVPLAKAALAEGRVGSGA
jgi:cardiolipin synthase